MLFVSGEVIIIALGRVLQTTNGKIGAWIGSTIVYGLKITLVQLRSKDLSEHSECLGEPSYIELALYQSVGSAEPA